MTLETFPMLIDGREHHIPIGWAVEHLEHAGSLLYRLGPDTVVVGGEGDDSFPVVQAVNDPRWYSAVDNFGPGDVFDTEDAARARLLDALNDGRVIP